MTDLERPAALTPSRMEEFSGSLKFFAYSLENSNEPKHCATCLFGCSISIDPDALGGMCKETPAEETRLDPLRAQFCSVVATFLMTPRTSQELTALVARLSVCTCVDTTVPLISAFHERGRNILADEWSPRTPSTMLILYLLSLLDVRINLAGRVKFAKGKGKCWPTDINDVMPFGSRALVTAVGQWMLFLDEPSLPLQVLTSALPVCGRPLFVEITTSRDFRKKLIISMKVITRQIRFGPVGKRLDRHNPWVRFADFMYAVMCARTSQNAIMAWVEGVEKQLWVVFTEAVTILRTPTMGLIPIHEEVHDDIDAVVRKFRSLIDHFSPAAAPKGRIHPQLVIEPYTEIRPEWDTEAGLLDLVIFLADLKRQPYCFVIGCPRSFQEMGNTFSKCAACNVPGYCSRACQATDWKDEDFPHKQYCKKINVFIAAAGGAKLNWDSPQDFMRKFRRSRLRRGDTTLQDIERWALVRRGKVESWDLMRARNAMAANV
ncbi:hypothetical protein C8R43DRAFT_444852 [Mycena crocata]|nr:hypothetical protein C8R43DRAFT_444852 [Mycena crocata]